MLPKFQLPFHPSITNCLAWSEDGDLAIAADDFVHILVSRISFRIQYWSAPSELSSGASTAPTWKTQREANTNCVGTCAVSCEYFHDS